MKKSCALVCALLLAGCDGALFQSQKFTLELTDPFTTQALPFVTEACPGLNKYARYFDNKRNPQSGRLRFDIISDNNIPVEYGIDDAYCTIDIKPDGSYLTLSSPFCQHVCLDSTTPQSLIPVRLDPRFVQQRLPDKASLSSQQQLTIASDLLNEMLATKEEANEPDSALYKSLVDGDKWTEKNFTRRLEQYTARASLFGNIPDYDSQPLGSCFGTAYWLKRIWEKQQALDGLSGKSIEKFMKVANEIAQYGYSYKRNAQACGEKIQQLQQNQP